MSGHEIYKSRHKICKKKFLSLTSIFFIKDNLIAIYIHMKEQQKRKIQQFHPENDDGIDLRRCPPESLTNMLIDHVETLD